MTCVQKSYENIKKLAIEKYNRDCPVPISILKEPYRYRIDSPRAFSQINDFNSLIYVLEKRSVISPADIGAFVSFYRILSLNENVLNEHKELFSLFNRQWIALNRYDGEQRPEVPDYELADHLMHNVNGVPTQGNDTTHRPRYRPQVLSEAVVDTVCCHVGGSWKSLARILGTTIESRINEILDNRNITNNKDRARLIMNEFQEKAEPSEVKVKLLRALRLLDMIRLHDKVEEMFLNEQ
uniref:Death domain-containing protein n=1 Tax=Homalodisca liturata TaxID=320908 RepID=A0A1B6JRY8_9HEMI